MGKEATVMSRTPIPADDPDLRHLAGPDAVIATGADRVTVDRVIDGTNVTAVKSVRLPLPLITVSEAVRHPGGFSGVVREALEEWHERHGGTQAEAEDVARALAVLNRAAARLQAAA